MTSTMRLSKRLQIISEMVIPCEIIADIGCDHGKLSCDILLNNKAKKVIATDISMPSLKKAEELAKELDINVETRLGDGLKVIKEYEADACIIAGMGGDLICSIIENSLKVAKSMKYMLLSPHTHTEKVRGFLNEKGFTIVKEKMIFEEDVNHYEGGRFYTVMLVKNGIEAPYSAEEAEFGRYLINNPSNEFIKYLKKSKAVCESILSKSFVENIALRFKMIDELIEKVKDKV